MSVEPKEPFWPGWWGLTRFLLAFAVFMSAGMAGTWAREQAAERFELPDLARFAIGVATFTGVWLAGCYGVIRPLDGRFGKPVPISPPSTGGPTG